METHSMNFVYFDVETERSADEVGGWQNIEQLGIAVAVTCTSRDDQSGEGTDGAPQGGWQFKIFRKHEAEALGQELQSADCVVGFNTRGFDFRVLQPYVDFDLRALPDLDLMVDLKRIAGFRPGLDNCCAATFNAKKSGGGLQSLQWWREGREDEVIEYCKQDVLLTRRLHEYGAHNGFVKCLDRQGRVRTLQVDWSLTGIAAEPQQGSLF
jgi:DEAD/DEAH box helicase domain-containing protein